MAAAVHVLGELWLSSATFAVVYDLAPDRPPGQYQGAHQTGRQIGTWLRCWYVETAGEAHITHAG